MASSRDNRAALPSLVLTVLIAAIWPAAGQSAPEQPGGGAPAPVPAAAQVPPDEPGADPSRPVSAEHDSPRSTMFTFLDAVNAVQGGQTGEIETAVACLDLPGAGISPGSHAARRTARDLWSALNRIRLVERSELPGPEELRPDQRSFVYFPRPFEPDDEAILQHVDLGDHVIALARMPDGRWLFSAATVAGIGELSRRLEPLARKVRVDEEALESAYWLRDAVPARLREGKLLGLEYWQWLGLLALIFLGFMLDQVVRAVARPIVHRVVRRFHSEVEERSVRETVRALGLLGAAIFWRGGIHALLLTGGARDIALAATGFFAVLTGAWAGWKLVDLVCEILLHQAERTESKFDDILIPLIRKTLKVFIIAFAVVYGAQNLNINIVPLITGLGIGGLAFAFAAKDTIENFFGSVAVILDRPFEVGDWVVIGDVEGTVEELGFRSTRVRTFYNSQVTIPNSTLVRATVDNYGRRSFRRWKTFVGVQYDTPPEKLVAFTEGIRELVRRHPYTRKDFYQVWCNDFADSSLNILLYIFHEVPDWSTELRERERMFVDIVRLADRLGVQFAFPTRTVHLFHEEKGAIPARHEVPRGTTERDAEAAGIRAAREITEQQPWRESRPGPVRFKTPTRPDVPESPEMGGDG
jgi:MscS family membrane protein